MKQNTNRITKLLDDYLNDRLSPDLLDEVISEILNESNAGLLEKITDSLVSERAPARLADRKKFDEKFRRLMEAARDYHTKAGDEFSEPVVKKAKRLSLWQAVAAAASLLILVALGSLWITGVIGPATGKKQITQMQELDLMPGGEKATLTLADGSTVALDTAANGLLATQGKTNIVKLSDGRIFYTRAGRETSRIQYNTITTPRGGEYNVTLPDSSRVWLNAESSIRFPVNFTDHERKVEITGEVYFEVEKMTDRPFRVSTGNTVVEVLGTSFNVRAYPDESSTATTLVEGSVKVITAGDERHIAPGQRAASDSNGLITVEDVDIEEITAWKNGIFLFNSESIDEIMNQIGRWYNVKIEFKGDPVNKTFSGIVSRKSNVSQVLSLMEPYGIKFKITDEMIIVESDE
ncbi:MAG: FecR domain-containing protein [Bacteroidales bacterium]|nr:FecR domain-containing protein [Bacteroidales bacterium]